VRARRTGVKRCCAFVNIESSQLSVEQNRSKVGKVASGSCRAACPRPARLCGVEAEAAAGQDVDSELAT
jgi:hypothetical protein